LAIFPQMVGHQFFFLFGESTLGHHTSRDQFSFALRYRGQRGGTARATLHGDFTRGHCFSAELGSLWGVGNAVAHIMS